MAKTYSIEEVAGLSGQLKYWGYNCADTTGTREVADLLIPRLQGATARIYAFERACQNAALAIMRRGLLVDLPARDAALVTLSAEVAVAIDTAARVVALVWDGTRLVSGTCPTPKRKDGRHAWEKWPKGEPEDERVCTSCGCSRLAPEPFNANSSTQSAHLFYELLGVKPQRNKKGEISTDEECVERIGRLYPKHTAICEAILLVRGLKKQIGFVKSRLSATGRFMSTASVGSTLTGRWSSTKNPQGYGGNAQNIAERHRHMFVADPGYELCYADLRQAESLVVAYMAEDENYIEAHQGDLHTYVTRVIWPTELPWTGDIAKDRKLAESHNPPWDKAPGHDYRFQAKRLSHGYGYGISAKGAARILHISEELAEHVHHQLDAAFPGIKRTYHPRVRERVTQQLPIVTPLGRPILLFGRPWDASTQRQGYSAAPQSLVADLVNISLYLIWRDLDPHLVQVLGNGYDAVLVQWPIARREEAARAVLERMTLSVPIGDRVCTIGVEIAIGQNWGKASENNPHGLRKVKL